MEVNRTNYLRVLPEILGKLGTAAFVSLDAEYTGLKCDDGETTSLFDNVAERYAKLRRVVMTNSAPQFGIAIFQRLPDLENQVYAVDAYSFFLSEPCFADFNMTTWRASVEIDCCQFLTGIKFDFAKWFKHSVPYLNENRRKELIEYLDKNPNFMETCENTGRTLDKRFFPDMIPDLTEEDKQDIVARLRGFSAIVDVISQRKIPVIGHNMILDLMYFFNQFCTDLPEMYNEFKEQVVTYVPRIFDTKYMTIRCRKMLDHPSLKHSKQDIAQLKCSGLYMIYTSSSAVVDKFSPIFILAENCKYFEPNLELGKTTDLEETANSTLCHQPSFDACVTGMVFLNLAHVASRMDKTMLERNEAPSLEDVLHGVRHWQDQIFIARATVGSMCLKGNDPRPNKSWVKVSGANGTEVDWEVIMKHLKSDPQKRFNGIDYQQINSKEVLLALTRIERAKEACAILKGLKFEAERIVIPWDENRLQSVAGCKTDRIYDTGRKAFLE